ncbi:helix-turn-helix domain-containing protein [Kluyvera intermedia]|uniref:helix-turn-helix domain-containing protein n=1 Tax=Kluyvera intermedia TaxID=61648 RepID=UPI003524CE94
MAALAAEFFTLDEVNRLKIIQDVIDRRLTTQMAAQRLGISDRQCRRLLSRYREQGPLGMANRRRGKPSNNQLPQGLAQYALNIIRERYVDFGPTLACEKLAELHGVHLSKETVRSLMVKSGLWIPRKQRAPKIQQPRHRRACCGELIQNAFADEFMADYNQRFAKAPRHDFDVHRPLEADDDLGAIFTWREPRRVSKSLTVQYDKVLYMIEDNELSRKAIGKYIEVWHYPNGQKELRLNGAALPYSTFDRLSEIDQGAIVDNKRLGRTLEFIKLVQDKRDNNRSQAIPCGNGPSRRRKKPIEKKSQRSLDGEDMLEALKTLQSRSEEIFGKK